MLGKSWLTHFNLEFCDKSILTREFLIVKIAITRRTIQKLRNGFYFSIFHTFQSRDFYSFSRTKRYIIPKSFCSSVTSFLNEPYVKWATIVPFFNNNLHPISFPNLLRIHFIQLHKNQSKFIPKKTISKKFKILIFVFRSWTFSLFT